MAKTSGGIRKANSKGRNFSKEARSMFNGIESNYGRAIDYSGHATKRLQQLQKIGRSYNPSEKEKVIANYAKNALQYSEAVRSNLIATANRASIYRDLDRITAELKRRKGR